MHEMKFFSVKLIFFRECVISYVKYVLYTTTSHVNFETVRFTFELGISYMKTLQFHIFFTCEMTCEIFVRDDCAEKELYPLTK